MVPESGSTPLTASLEDYLETIFQLVTDQRVARVRDIAKARGVRAGSVTPAMRRLAALGLIEYEARGDIELTAEGERQARRVLARHNILSRFLHEILSMEQEAAERDACSMEHHLSDEAMDRLVAFFEFLQLCPSRPNDFLERFRTCRRLGASDRLGALGVGSCTEEGRACAHSRSSASRERSRRTTVDALPPGLDAKIVQVHATGAIRQRLLDMGVLPGVTLRVERLAPSGDPVWIRMEGYQISLRRAEAETIIVEPSDSPTPVPEQRSRLSLWRRS